MRAPRLVNSMLHAPGIDRIAKWMGGVAHERELPSFAAQSFRSWFQQRSTRNQGKPTVLLWPDTFNNNFKPETAKAAVSVLEHAGFHVEIPGPMLCCGRPLYDYGMLGLAKALLHQVLESLRPQIRDGVPIVGLEPSCVAVFRDELVNLFPHDLDAQRLSKQTYLLSEFLAERAPGSLPSLKRKAIVQGHCHHKAVIGMDAEQEVMRKLGLDFQVLDSGCCGMAGSFGYEEGDRYTVSLKAGERVLLPSVRQAAKDTLVLADGFSCREQIEQLTDRKALHLAEVIHMAIEEGPSGRQGSYPEQAYAEAVPRVSVPAAAGVMAAGAVLTAGLVFVSRISNKRR
jgi:Fe-S oxidoreductase